MLSTQLANFLRNRVRTLFSTKNSRTFKDSFPIFQGLHAVQKRDLSSSFLVLPQHELVYPEGLSVFVPLPLEFYLNYTVSNEIQGLSSTDHNFQGLSRP